MLQEFYSNGKLLLSGEYAVLDGALAWAIPTKFGQSLQVNTNGSLQLSWQSLDEKGAIWFEGTYDLTALNEIISTDSGTSETLQKIIIQARQLNPFFLSDLKGYEVKTKLTFQKDWGLGTSSTLINNIAKWANINAFELSQHTFGGSGYDIACAQYDTPILYQLGQGTAPVIREIDRHPSFKNSLYFVYLNQKKNSRDAIAAYKERVINKTLLTEEITEITKRLISSKTLSDFEELMTIHEQLLSNALNIPTIKSELFPDHSGAIKSLGAWGGDFVLASGDDNTPDYFHRKGYLTVIPYEKMIL